MKTSQILRAIVISFALGIATVIPIVVILLIQPSLSLGTFIVVAYVIVLLILLVINTLADNLKLDSQQYEQNDRRSA
jgi:hypothetical protein